MLGVLFLILPLLTNSFGAKKVFAEETAAQVILHKKKMTDLPDPLIQNSGKEMSEFDQYQGLADISFSVYNSYIPKGLSILHRRIALHCDFSSRWQPL